jgi:hypothetical protein
MFMSACKNLVGKPPSTDERVRIYQDIYFGCNHDCDAHAMSLLQSLQGQSSTQNKIFSVSTACRKTDSSAECLRCSPSSGFEALCEAHSAVVTDSLDIFLVTQV